MKKLHSFEIRDTNKTRNDIENFLMKTKYKLDKFFKVKLPIPRCFLLNSRGQFNKIRGYKTEKWMVGWAEDGNIFILKPEKFAKESDHKKENFRKVLKHECCHIYYHKLTNISYPKWLNEGLACYLARQIKNKPDKKTALKVIDYYDRSDFRVFPIGYYWTRYLIKNYGKEKLLRLINFLKNRNGKVLKRQFEIGFYKIYKFKFNKKELSLRYK